MNDEEDISAYFLQVDEVVNSLRGLGEKVNEKMIVQKVLRSLLDHFDAKVRAIEEIKYLDSLSMDELHGNLIAYEMRVGNSTHKEATFKASK